MGLAVSMPSRCRNRRKVFQNSSNVNSKRWIVPSITISSGSDARAPHRTGPARCLSSPWSSCRVSSFIEQPSLAMHAAPETLRQIVHQYEVDQQQRIRFLFEIEVEPRPLSRSIPGASIARSMSERSKLSPRARSRTARPARPPGARRGAGRARGSIRDAGNRRAGTSLVLRCSSTPSATIARIATADRVAGSKRGHRTPSTHGAANLGIGDSWLGAIGRGFEATVSHRQAHRAHRDPIQRRFRDADRLT